jgi:hypothetical protein
MIPRDNSHYEGRGKEETSPSKASRRRWGMQSPM